MPISKKNKVHIDSRGSLHECMNIGGEFSDVPSGGHLYAFTILPKKSRGNHFHTKKEEWFMCLHGEVEIVLINEKTQIKQLNRMQGMDGKLYYIPALTRHTFINNSDQIAVIVSYGSEIFNPSNPDTFFKDI